MSLTLQQGRRVQNLNVRIENSFLDSLRAVWDEAAVELGATIYMSYDWCKTWWDFYGANAELKIFFFYDRLESSQA